MKYQITLQDHLSPDLSTIEFEFPQSVWLITMAMTRKMPQLLQLKYWRFFLIQFNKLSNTPCYLHKLKVGPWVLSSLAKTYALVMVNALECGTCGDRSRG